jgi:molybdate transport system substrate-binding protein
MPGSRSVASRRALIATLAATVCAVALAPARGVSQTPVRLTIAAASDLQAALPEVIRAFERQTSAAVSASYGSSGSFFAQIQNGAPFDVFLSADMEYPRRLVEAGQADNATLVHYATGHLALWVRRESPVDLSRGLIVVTDRQIRRLAVANPKYAPFGRAAMAALQSAGLYERIQDKVVLGENLAQTAQLVESGNADAGLISLSLALGPALSASGRHTEIPSTLHPPIAQGAVVVSRSTQPALARRFLTFLRQPDTVATLRRFGFTPAATR